MSDALVPGTRLGPYEIDNLIGAGGMGQVYRARDPRLGRNVAIKTLNAAGASDPDLIRRFETEARAAGGLDHPNLLVVYDVGREGDISYIVSELLDGETLRVRLKHGALSARQAIDYTVQITRGLAAAHARGIVHRDLKPDNLFITRDGRVKILDFGVAKLIEAPKAEAATTLADSTGTGVVIGTAGYMAPEQVRAEPIDHRVDIFALGVVLHEMLSGDRPFRRDTTADTLTAILRDEAPELPATVTPALQRIVGRCLEKRPENRFHSAHDLGLALELLSTSNTTSAVAATDRAPGVSRRRALVYGGSALALAASGLAGAAFLGGRSAPSVLPSYRRLTFRRGLIRSARVAPDAQTVLYGALWDGNACRVHASRVDSAESNALDLPDASVLAISRSGELALAMGAHFRGINSYGTLARVPMAGGVPRQLVESVKFADWSPDGADLAIIRGLDGRDRLEFPVGKVLVEPKVGESNGLGFARVSPDGKHVAFVHHANPNFINGRVSVTDLAGNVTPLSADFINIHGLAWRGDEIWYTAADEGPFYRTIRAVRPGGTERTVTRVPGNMTLWDVLPDGRLIIAYTDDRTVMIAKRSGDAGERDLSWFDASVVGAVSPDGRRLLFSEYGQGAGVAGGVYLRGLDGSPAVRLSDGMAWDLSPDGQWAICFRSRVSPYLELVPTGAGDRRRLPENGLSYLGARFLPDGKRIIVWGFETGRPPKLFLLDIDQGRPIALTPEGVNFPWTVSPDGTTLAAAGPDPAITLYPLDRSTPKAVPGTAGSLPLAWINEGLLVGRPYEAEASSGQVYKVDPATGRQQPWRDILPADPTGIMNFISLQVTPDGQSAVYSWHRALSNLYIAEGLA